ncbi:MAG: efflux transporter outer membrane subunit [Deltaproteobacteria bacterium]|nr:efflux transporter outer membrane subunit [Deltaproteobacteria bacterium]MBW1952940.1 efflux transporter outer membrane subunit [Deltaproteobacteria bacterium]MBW1986448.1 efflux transporter outer membrane subunit [Deltaproteobacteria bacterium]MBW2135539.1 efflux transporter outer membrane subunit [Deltaproteobacteria bacterium]
MALCNQIKLSPKIFNGNRPGHPGRGRFFGLALLLVLAYGCTKVGPDYVRPPVKVLDNWLEVDDKRVKTDFAEYRDWWQVFNDPVLNQLIDLAYQENLNLRLAGVRVLEARAQLGVAVGELFPQTQQAFGSVEKIRESGRSPQAVPGSELGYAQSQIGLGASWEIDFWGKFRRAIESADASLAATIANYDSTLVSLTAEVATFYILSRTLEKRLSIARRNVELQKESLQIAEARFQGGTTSQRDVEQAKTVLASTQATIPTLDTQLRQARHALSILLGRPPGQLADLLAGKSEIPAPPPQVVVGIPADLLRRRPDIRRAELQAASQCARIGIAKADLYPAFSLTGSFGFQASDVRSFSLGDMFEWRSRTGSIGPSFLWNILNYGRLTNRVRIQDARFQERLIAYQNTVLKAQQEVEDALIAFLRAQERAEFLAESAAAAIRSLDLAVLQYREGITDFTTVLTAQQALLQQQDNLARTMGHISSNLVGVYRALGGGWQLRQGRDFVPTATKEVMAKRTNWGRLLTPVDYVPSPPD